MEEKKNLIVKKANRLNQTLMVGSDTYGEIIHQECSFSEYRFWLLCLALAQRRETNSLTVTFDELAQLLALKRDDPRTIVSSLSKCIEMKVIIPESKTKLRISAVFTDFAIDLNAKTIEVSLNPTIVKAQSELNHGYTMIMLDAVNNCNRSLSAVRLYELCKQYVNQGRLVVTDVPQFLQRLGCKDLKEWRMRRMDQWVKTVNEGTDLHISYTTETEKRHVRSITFYIKKSNSPPKKNTDNFFRSMVASEMFVSLTDQKISLRECTSIAAVAFEVYPFEEDENGFDRNRDARDMRINRNIALLKFNLSQGKEINNPVAWLKAAILSDYASQTSAI